jgi:uncharacterized protein YbcC (UPF0753/DUF2309 family)
VEGDLRTGLPSQMIEVHEPARLLIVIEQTREIIDATLAKLEELKEWPDNDWVRMAACEPDSRNLYLYSKNGWQDIKFPNNLEIPESDRSEKIIVGQDKTIPVHQFTGRLS